MMPLAAFVTVSDERALQQTVPVLEASGLVDEIALGLPGEGPSSAHTSIRVPSFWSGQSVVDVLSWLSGTRAEYLLWVFPGAPILHEPGLERLVQCAREAGSVLTYGDYVDLRAGGTTRTHSLVDYQLGSIRDDFAFGPMILLDRSRLRPLGERLAEAAAGLEYGGWYDLRLRLSEGGDFLHVPEPLCMLPEADLRASGEKVFDYVDPKNRDVQIEMERVATEHLERIGARLDPPAGKPVDDDRSYPVAASVVIPVKNRVETIGDAVASALVQQAPFAFNVIVVDNHSDDGTTEVLAEIRKRDPRLVHIRPRRVDLGIGGCWHEAIFSEYCGRYAIQLDSDDIYDGEDVVGRIVTEMERGQCAALVGAYTTVGFDLSPLPPGLVDHSEWTDRNGHNNALRIHGLGAPRAYHVPTLRTIGFPNVSYGEDYAVMLKLSRSYKIGRIFDSLYWCRRWEGNTDSALPLETSNRYAVYKDRVRSLEIAARQRLNETR